MPVRFLPLVFVLWSGFAFKTGFTGEPIAKGPVITTREISRVREGTPYSYQVRAADSLGRKIRFGAKTLPGGLQFDPATQRVSGKISVPGQYLVRLFAIAGMDTAWQNYMLTVYDQHTTNILCLGNSITNGVGVFNSYRRDLWFLLHGGQYDFDLIGSWSKHHWGTEVPDPDFDMDHEGHSGWTIPDMFQAPSWDSTRGNIFVWLREYDPGIVLIELGTNDVFQCRSVPEMIGDMGRLVRVLRRRNPRVKLFIAQIPPLGPRWAGKMLCHSDTTYDQRLRGFNSEIPGLVRQLNSRESPVEVVDQYTGVDPAKDQFDDIHPNAEGEKIMAGRWFKAIEPDLVKLPHPSRNP